MKYVDFKGKKLSKLGFGTLRLPYNEQGNVDLKKVELLVDYSMSRGINYYDLGFSYGKEQAEIALGKALSKYHREDYYLIDKLPSWRCKAEEDVEKIFNTQLERCGVEYFDFYLIHSIKDHRYSDIERLGLQTFLTKKKEKGSIKHIGASFHSSPEILRKVLENYGDMLDFVQLQINYMDWECFEANKMYEIAMEFKKPIMIMEPLRGGMLVNPISAKAKNKLDEIKGIRSYADLGIKFISEMDGIFVTLSGMNTIEQIRANIEAIDSKVLSQEEIEVIKEAGAILGKDVLIPCTKCDYCEACPAQIKISAIFDLYNDVAAADFNRPWIKISSLYANFEKNASDCLNCGLCMTHCPQNINIPIQLKKVHEKFDELYKEGK